MIKSLIRLAALSAGLLLTACGEPASDPPPPPSPLIYEIASADGTVEGWLFGTIHALPGGTEWRTPAIDRAIDEADVLVVEVASLDDRAAASALFSARAAGADGTDVLERVPGAVRPALAGLAAEGRVDLDDLRTTDTWAAALILAAGVRYGDADNGVDRALLQQFGGRRVVELEGMTQQLDLFDALPEREQRDMLVAVVKDYQQWSRDPGHLARAWLTGDIEEAIDPAQSALLADPELRDMLLVSRNRAWAPKIDALLKGGPSTMIAVGAGHIPGPDGLAALLEQRGYTLRPLR
jgi:hypothetical protein